MKTPLFLLLFLPAVAAAQVKVYPKIALDYFPGKYQVNNLYENITLGEFRARIGADLGLTQSLTAYFEQHVYMNQAGNVYFQPVQANWFVGAKLKIYDKLKLSIEHLCIHPVESYGHATIRIYGGYNMVSISWGY